MTPVNDRLNISRQAFKIQKILESCPVSSLQHNRAFVIVTQQSNPLIGTALSGIGCQTCPKCIDKCHDGLICMLFRYSYALS